MNLFYLHLNPKKCAIYHCDKHVVKMIIETAQLLSIVHWLTTSVYFKPLNGAELPGRVELSKEEAEAMIAENYKKIKTADSESAKKNRKKVTQIWNIMAQSTKFDELVSAPVYRPTHVHHPIAKWLMESIENYRWTGRLGQALSKEYTYRYGKVHACDRAIQWLVANEPVGLPETKEMTTVRMCMPDPCKEDAKNPIAAYRHLYVVGKAEFCKWTNRSVPGWFAYGRSLVDKEATKEELYKSEKLRSLDEFEESDDSVDDGYEPPEIKLINYYEDGLQSKEAKTNNKAKATNSVTKAAKQTTTKSTKSAPRNNKAKAKHSRTRSDDDMDEDFIPEIKRRRQRNAK